MTIFGHPKWIRTADKFPTRADLDDSHCLLAWDGLLVRIVLVGMLTDSGITHWMPLPKPPKDSER
jgi:hypothetical protein